MALTQVDPGLLNTQAQYTGFKNRIINGAMGIWQRGTSVTASTYTYLADRWANGVWGVSTTASRSTDTASGFQYSLKIQRPASATTTTITGAIQTIESVNCYDLSSQTVTLSFWAKAGANFSSSGSNLGMQINTGTAADQGGNTYGTWTGLVSSTSAVVLTTSWQKFTYTVTFGAGILESAVVFYYVPVGTAGADDAFYITGVQLEKGSTATSFDYRPYGTELALCQRYCLVYGGNKIYERVGVGSSDQTTSGRICSVNPVPMRSTPTMSYSSLSDWQLVLPGIAGVATTAITLSTDESSPLVVFLLCTISSNASFGSSKCCNLAGNGTLNARITYSAEL
jgi:hypothetical protein